MCIIKQNLGQMYHWQNIELDKCRVINCTCNCAFLKISEHHTTSFLCGHIREKKISFH